MIGHADVNAQTPTSRVTPLHLASPLLLDDYAVGDLSTEEFQRLFSLTNSRYLALGKCLAEIHE